jgi:hypothetical protein
MSCRHDGERALAQNVQNVTERNGITRGGNGRSGCCASLSSRAVDPGVRGGPPPAAGSAVSMRTSRPFLPRPRPASR